MTDNTERDKPRNTLAKRERLSGTKRIDALFKEGKSGFIYPFRYFVRPMPIEGLAQRANERERVENGPNIAVLISVPKRYHKRANRRNLIKRRTKEVYRTNKYLLHSQTIESVAELHIALIYSSKDLVDYKKIEDAVKKILAAIKADV